MKLFFINININLFLLILYFFNFNGINSLQASDINNEGEDCWRNLCFTKDPIIKMDEDYEIFLSGDVSLYPEKFHLKGKIISTTWLMEDQRLSCEFVQLLDQNNQYLVHSYRGLMKKALTKIAEADGHLDHYLTTFPHADYSDDYGENNFIGSPLTNKTVSSSQGDRDMEEIIEEMNKLQQMIEKSYPLALSQPDRIITYQFEFGTQFKDRIAFPADVPQGEVKIKKIKFGENPWINVPENFTLKGYMNFLQHPQLRKKFPLLNRVRTPPYVDINDVQVYYLEAQRKVSPLEYCLGDNKYHLQFDIMAFIN